MEKKKSNNTASSTKINATSTMFLNRKQSKVSTGKKTLSMINAVMRGTRPQRFKARFMMPGLTNYPNDAGEQEMWWLPRDVMTQMQKGFIGCPVVIDSDHNGEATPESFNEFAKGVVVDVWTDIDGWDWCSFMLWDKEAIDKLLTKGWNISCAYNTVKFKPGGVLNAIDYEHEVVEGEYIHLAIVPAPRQTGARVFLNTADTDDTGDDFANTTCKKNTKSIDNAKASVILFDMNGKKYKLFANGKENIEGGQKMSEEKKAEGEKEDELKKSESENKDEKEKTNESKEPVEIDPETAVVETPDGDVVLSELIAVYQAEQAEIAKKAELDKEKTNESAKISMDDEYEGISIKKMYDSYKKNKAADGKESKETSREEILRSEGKTDDEIKEVLEKEKEAKKSAKVNHFNSMRSLKNSPVSAQELKPRLSTRDRIKAARGEY